MSARGTLGVSKLPSCHGSCILRVVSGAGSLPSTRSFVIKDLEFTV